MTVNELIKAIDALTKDILEKVTADQVSDIDGSVDSRTQLITALIALSPSAISAEALSLYLRNILQQDERIAEVATEQRALVKKTLLGMENLREYFNVPG